MNLEQKCTSLDLAKRLKELNIPQESLFYLEWVNDNCYGVRYFPYCVTPRNSGEFLHYSAFTAGELLQLLPYHITSKEPEPFNSYRLYISGSVIVKNPECIDPIRIHMVNYREETISMESKETILAAALGKYLTNNIWDENPANALAKMLIFLIETGLLKND